MDRDEELRRRRGEHTRSYSQDRPIGSGDNAKAIVRGVKQWYDEIGDFGSTGLLGTSKGFYTKDEAYKMLADPAYKELGPELLDALDSLDSVHTPGTNPEYDAILEAYRAQNPGYAQGGLVGRQDFGGVVGYILD